jgi:hypothetical protein
MMPQTKATVVGRVSAYHRPVEPQGFDLAASLLRADSADAQTLAEALATKLATALPEQTAVRRKGSGLLSREKRVERIEVRLGDETFSLSVARHGAQAIRGKTVHGVVIKRDELPLEQWLQLLDRALAAEAQRSETARVALERLLG